jgi:hypothetical protein
LNEQHTIFDREGVESMLTEYNSLIHFCSKDLIEIQSEEREYAEKHGIPLNKLTPILISKLKKFKARFLQEYPEWGPMAD